MTTLNDFYSYRDRFGLIQITPGEPALTSDNGALFTVEYFLMLNENDRRIERERLKIVLRNLEQKTDNGVVTLLYPGCRYTDSMDNATALIIFSELFDDSRLSKELYKKFGYINNNFKERPEFVPEEVDDQEVKEFMKLCLKSGLL